MRGSAVKAHIEPNWTDRTVLVWLYSEVHSGGRAYLRCISGEAWEWQEVAEGEQVPPTLVLPDACLKALVAEGADYAPASAATERHLLDTISVRDRLLALMEGEQ